MRRFVFGLAVLLALVVPQGIASANSTYNGDAAANWAALHSQDTQPNFPSCTWFASQALWAGGLKQDSEWNSNDLLRGLKYGVSGSRTATLAQDLYAYLLRSSKAHDILLSGPKAKTNRLTRGNNAVPEAHRGDLIAYDWDGDGTVDHLSVITNISPGNYPDVSEWGTVPQGTNAPYFRRGWTWSELHKNDPSKQWLESDNPKMIVHLLVIAS